jgi:hypothetical protein
MKCARISRKGCEVRHAKGACLMRILLFRGHPQHSTSIAGLAGVLIASLLVLALLCPLGVLRAHQGGQEVCPHYPWFLVPGAAILLVAAVSWLPHASRFSRLREYPLLVFRPPRLVSI